MPDLDHPDLQYLLALSMAPSIGPVKARSLLYKFKSARSIFQEKKHCLQKVDGIGNHSVQSLSSPSLLRQAETELNFMERHRIRVLYEEDVDYPRRLRQCYDRPLLLFIRGENGLHSKRMLSVVGTRKATVYGREQCERIVSELAEIVDNLSVVSGLAYGIDVTAHRISIRKSIPTVAVLGHGFSTIYPRFHRQDARKIAHVGSLVTDFPSYMGPERNNFLRRNRIIAGLSDATLVVESALTGGALITAKMAFSYDRLVMSVPGRTVDERSRGCNGLIKRNIAGLVESAEDVLYHAEWEPDRCSPAKSTHRALPADETERALWIQVERSPGIDPSALSRQEGIPVHRVLTVLLEMELKGWIRVEPGNSCYVRTPPFHP